LHILRRWRWEENLNATNDLREEEFELLPLAELFEDVRVVEDILRVRRVQLVGPLESYQCFFMLLLRPLPYNKHSNDRKVRERMFV
jgi:hypothetical protein